MPSALIRLVKHEHNSRFNFGHGDIGMLLERNEIEILQIVRSFAARGARMNSIPEVCASIRQNLERRRSKNTRYSMRAFARDIGISPSTLSRILRGKLVPGPAVWVRIAEQLEVSDADNLRILTMIIKGQARRVNGSAQGVDSLSP
jgi:hypothetical protein